MKSVKLDSLSTATVYRMVHQFKINKHIAEIEAAKKKLEEELYSVFTNPMVVDWIEEKDGTITLVETFYRRPDIQSMHGDLEYACYRLNEATGKYEEDATLRDLETTRKGRKHDEIPPLRERVEQFMKKAGK